MGFTSPAIAVLVTTLLLGTLQCWAYYVPGTYPMEFEEGDNLQANVNSLKSFDTEMPYEYYTMPFCRPPEGVRRAANTANPGAIIEGLRIENSPYNFTVKVEETGKKACVPDGFYSPLTAAEVKNLKHKIDGRYRVNMLLDNLPVTTYDLLDEDQEYVRPGFELGFKKDGKYYINNHLSFNILVALSHGEYLEAMKHKDEMAAMENRRQLYRHGRKLRADPAAKPATAASPSPSPSPSPKPSPSPSLSPAAAGGVPVNTAIKAAVTATDAAKAPSSADKAEPKGDDKADKAEEEEEEEGTYYMVVGFEVAPCSVKAGMNPQDVACDPEDAEDAQEIVEGARISYTYDVYWQESSIKWASRWDAYLRMPGGKVHWFSIMNSVIVVLIMASLVALIFIRTIRRDLSKYEQLLVDSSNLDVKDEAGWKLVIGDVFRAPGSSKTLAVQVGSGVQIVLTSAVILLLATMGFLSPASRGALLTTTMVLFVWLALVAGFAATYVWGIMERSYTGWPHVCALVSLFFPGIVLMIFTLLNLVINHTGTSGAVPIGMYFGIVFVWFLVSIPLTFVGGYAAIRMPIRENPVKTNQIPRHVPPAPLAANSTLLFFVAGVLPFGTIFIELYFAMTSVWLGYFYYLFGFVFLIGLLAVIINAEISVMCTYVQLCAEDYNWWWASFRRGGSVALYVAVYALFFMFNRLTSMSGFLPVFIYLCYMSIITLGLYFAMGTVGFAASYFFVHYIFQAVKAE